MSSKSFELKIEKERRQSKRRTIGVTATGIKGPIIKQGDDLIQSIVCSLEEAVKAGDICLMDKDIIGITESVVARAQGNFVTEKDIADDIRTKYQGDKIGIVFPILSRNRFLGLLEAIAKVDTINQIIIQLSYPSDEVGNHLISQEQLDFSMVDPYNDSLTEKQFYQIFEESKHEYTGIDYIQLYKSACNGKATVIFSNNPREILKYTDEVLVSDIHTRNRTKRFLKEVGAKVVYGLDEILTNPIDGSGYNPDVGLLGSNISRKGVLKLFPRDCDKIVRDIQVAIKERFGYHIEVLIYGDGAYKDPTSKIWELADPVVSPGYTDGLNGTPNEIKLKYAADELAEKGLSQEEIKAMMKDIIKNKPSTNTTNASLGTTPRNIVNLIGSLCDLTSGSGDKGTPFVLVQGYFSNYAD